MPRDPKVLGSTARLNSRLVPNPLYGTFPRALLPQPSHFGQTSHIQFNRLSMLSSSTHAIYLEG